MSQPARLPASDAPEAATALVPLADCYIHALNTRSEPPAADIEALAESIEAIGLLQNLAGWFDPASPSAVGIVAGGRRLRALILLAKRDGRDPGATRVPVRIAPDEDTARLWASAENTARAALHPADEVRAYDRMARAGADPQTIARAFAVTERHVRQRLKLAALPVTALAALRESRISLDQAAALTAAQSSEALDAELERVLTSRWSTTSSEIRQRLQQASISPDDRRVKLVSLEAYRNAGGTVQEDLFTDQLRLLDEALLDQLVESRMADAVTFQQLRGWKWVIAKKPDQDLWKLSDGMARIYRNAVDLPDADAAELEELSTRGESEELTEDEIARMEELEARAEGDYSDDDVATSGVILCLGIDGNIQVEGPYRKPEDNPAIAANGGDETGGKVESKALPNSLLEDLRKIRLAALQHRAAAQTELMLDLLALQLSGAVKPWERVLMITADRQSITPEKPDGLELPASLADPRHGDDAATAEAFAAFRALGKKHRNEVLTRALARSLPAHRELGPLLAAQLAPDPRQIWTPTADGYFKRLPVPVLDALWTELVPEDRREGLDFESKKKAEKAKLLDRLFNEADFREALQLDRATSARLDAWSPEQLQWPAVEARDA